MVYLLRKQPNECSEVDIKISIAISLIILWVLVANQAIACSMIESSMLDDINIPDEITKMGASPENPLQLELIPGGNTKISTNAKSCNCYIEINADFTATIQFRLKYGDHLLNTTPYIKIHNAIGNNILGIALEEKDNRFYIKNGHYFLNLDLEKLLSSQEFQHIKSDDNSTLEIEIFKLKNHSAQKLQASKIQSIPFKIIPGSFSGGSHYYDIDIKNDALWKISLSGDVEKYFEEFSVTRAQLSLRELKTRKEISPIFIESKNHENIYIYSLIKGKYQVEIGSSTNSWPRKDANNHLNLKFSVEGMQSQVKDAWVSQINSWLSEIGIGDIFQITYTASINDLDFTGNHLEHLGHEKALLARLNEIATIREKIAKQSPINMKQINNRSTTDSPQLPPGDYLPTLFIQIEPHPDRHTVRRFEQEFSQEQNISFWERFFRKVTLLTGRNTSSVYVYVPLWCDATDVTEWVPGHFSRRGSICMSGGAGRKIPAALGNMLSSPSTRSLAGLSSGFRDSVSDFLNNIVSKNGGDLQYVYRDDSYVEGIVRGVRGWVVKGGNQWEKLQIGFSLLGSTNNIGVRVFVDGMLAPAIGDQPPPDTKFTYSMEPQHAGNLTAFADNMIDEFIDTIARR